MLECNNCGETHQENVIICEKCGFEDQIIKKYIELIEQMRCSDVKIK